MNQFDLRDNYAKFLFHLGYPFNVTVADQDGKVVRPPVPVLDVLIGLYIDEDDKAGGHDERDAYRASFAICLGVDPWAR